MDESISLRDFEKIENDIRQRLDDLDQRYRKEREPIEHQLEECQKMKRSMLDYIRNYRNSNNSEPIRPTPSPTAPTIRDATCKWPRKWREQHRSKGIAVETVCYRGRKSPLCNQRIRYSGLNRQDNIRCLIQSLYELNIAPEFLAQKIISTD